MPILHIKGKVFPPAVHLTIKNLPPVDWDEPSTGQTMRITTRIDDSAVDVEFEVNFFDNQRLTDIVMRAWDLSSIAVNIYAYSYGYGMTVLLDTLIHPDGTKSDLMSRHDDLAGICKAFDLTLKNAGVNDLPELYKMISSDIGLFITLNDLASAITFPHVASINSARAVEGIRNLIASGIERNKGWEIMRSSLNVDQEYVRFVTGLSTAPRHGDRTAIPTPNLVETLNRAWTIMDRYLAYRRRGSEPLMLTEFPTLQG